MSRFGSVITLKDKLQNIQPQVEKKNKKKKGK